MCKLGLRQPIIIFCTENIAPSICFFIKMGEKALTNFSIFVGFDHSFIEIIWEKIATKQRPSLENPVQLE